MTQITNGTMKQLSILHIFYLCHTCEFEKFEFAATWLIFKCLQAPKIIIEEGEGGIIGKIVHCVAVSFLKLLVAGRFKKIR